ncbi:hypothetical protein B0H16DRAFT_1733023 [Mycena metata]|uniref:Uncharacterized protein n=1 Tax=Mycena metata TaxID=1033252 RepID=A0AAD7I0S9_9AGAR|nr:hypothetical protein B0H16DRAFT_1733023 [Mycena metata]
MSSGMSYTHLPPSLLVFIPIDAHDHLRPPTADVEFPKELDIVAAFYSPIPASVRTTSTAQQSGMVCGTLFASSFQNPSLASAGPSHPNFRLTFSQFPSVLHAGAPYFLAYFMYIIGLSVLQYIIVLPGASYVSLFLPLIHLSLNPSSSSTRPYLFIVFHSFTVSTSLLFAIATDAIGILSDVKGFKIRVFRLPDGRVISGLKADPNKPVEFLKDLR